MWSTCKSDGNIPFIIHNAHIQIGSCIAIGYINMQVKTIFGETEKNNEVALCKKHWRVLFQ